jgi:hypothetical protein
VLVELFFFGTVAPNRPDEAKAAGVYLAFMDTPPPPKVEAKWPPEWEVVWNRLCSSGLPPAIVDKFFRLLHNILPLRGRLATLGSAADGACPHCGESEDVVHFFQRCPRVANLWDALYVKLVFLVPVSLLTGTCCCWPSWCVWPLWRGWWWPIWEFWWLKFGMPGLFSTLLLG